MNGILEIPQERYLPQSSFIPQDTLYFDVKLIHLLNLADNDFSQDWFQQWTYQQCGQKASIRVYVSIHYSQSHDNVVLSCSGRDTPLAL